MGGEWSGHRRAGKPTTAWSRWPGTRSPGSWAASASTPRSTSATAGGRVPQHVLDLPRLQHLHEGQGPARRPLHHQPHLRHLRRQPRHVLRATPRTWPTASRRRPWASGSSTWARPPSTCSTTTSSRRTWSAWTSARRWSRETNPGVLSRPSAPSRRTPATTATRPSPTSCGRSTRSRRVLPRGPPGQPLHPRDVLPHGGPARPPLDAVPRRRGHHGHRPAVHRLLHPAHALRGVHEAGRPACTTTCSTSSTRRCPATRRSAAAGSCWAAGARSRPRGLQLQLRGHDQVGPRHVRHPRRRRRRQAWSPTTSSTSTWASGSCSATPTTTTGRTRRCSSTRDPLGNPVDRRHPWNQHTNPAAAEARLRRQLQLGRWRRAGSTAPTTWPLDTGGGPLARLWSTALSGRSTTATSRPPGTAS